MSCSFRLNLMKIRNMKNVTLRTSLIAILMLVFGSSLSARQSIQIGTELPAQEISVKDVNERSVTLASVSKSNGLIVIFSSNTCPWISRWEDRMKSIATKSDQNGIGFIALNSNERIRGRGESISDMKRRSDKQNYNFIYALDKDHRIADALGATESPEVFFFDGSKKLVYKGSIDDNPNRASSVKNHYLSNAIDAVISGETIVNAVTQGQGCSIKRVR